MRALAYRPLSSARDAAPDALQQAWATSVTKPERKPAMQTTMLVLPSLVPLAAARADASRDADDGGGAARRS